MPVVSDYILYVGNTAYDLRKVSAVVPVYNDPAAVDVRFIDDPRLTVRFNKATFEAAWQACLDMSATGISTYMNPNPVPVTIGGITAGTSFPIPQTMQQMWDMLLYPTLYPQFTAFGISGQTNPREVGSTIPASITFTWSTSNPGNVAPNTIEIIDVTGGNVTLASGLANDGSEPIVLGAPVQLLTAGSYSFKIEGTNTAAGTFSSTTSFTWRWKLYYGANASPTLSSAQILALPGTALPSSYAGTYPVPAAGYKYICLSDSAGGQITTVKDNLTGFNVPMATVADNAAYSNVDGGGFSYALVSVTNVEGVTSNYRVYRTKNSLGGAVTLVVT